MFVANFIGYTEVEKQECWPFAPEICGGGIGNCAINMEIGIRVVIHIETMIK
jgi:hypothetical protein